MVQSKIPVTVLSGYQQGGIYLTRYGSVLLIFSLDAY